MEAEEIVFKSNDNLDIAFFVKFHLAAYRCDVAQSLGFISGHLPLTRYLTWSPTWSLLTPIHLQYFVSAWLAQTFLLSANCWRILKSYWPQTDHQSCSTTDRFMTPVAIQKISLSQPAKRPTGPVC